MLSLILCRAPGRSSLGGVGGVLPPLGTGVPGLPKTGGQLLTQLSPDVAGTLSLFFYFGGVGDQSQRFAHNQVSTPTPSLPPVLQPQQSHV